MSRSSDARRNGRAPLAPTSAVHSPSLDGQSQTRAIELLKAAQFGDRAAFGEIVLLYQDRLFNTLLRLVGNADDAAELCQETFARALQKLSEFRGEAGPYTWMFRIATNLALTELRKRQTRRTFTIGDGGDGSDSNGHGHQAAALVQRMESVAPSPARQVEEREMHERVVAALGRIDAEQRFLVVMRDVEGFDYHEMAQVLDVPMGTLKSRLFRARLALREQLKSLLGQDAGSQGR
jgi:RNA polymerase sigma-70 factor (ECF subfamily)